MIELGAAPLLSTLHRQAEETSIPELYGQRCSAFGAVVRAGDERWGPAHLQLDSGWHRFYLDAGLLFWAEIVTPDGTLRESEGSIGAGTNTVNQRSGQHMRDHEYVNPVYRTVSLPQL